MRETFSWKVGEAIGFVFSKCLFGFFKLLWAGIVGMSKRNIGIAVIYIFVIPVMILTYFLLDNYSFVLTFAFVFALIMGIVEMIIVQPEKNRRKYFDGIFREIKLIAPNESVPYYLYEKELSEFSTIVAFGSLIPLSNWYAKKELLETYLNVSIVNIQQDESNRRIVTLTVQKQTLPDYIYWSDEHLTDGNTLNIGVGYYGVVGVNLEKYPHAFIAGETGSGKSNILKCMIHQSLAKGYDIILIDFKRGVSFSAFNDVLEIYFEYDTVVRVLQDLVSETKTRLDKFRAVRVDNIKDYNRYARDFLYRKIIFIDELAELLKTRDKATANILNDCIETLTRLSRATGIHLIMGIQRPDSTVISGQIKNNVSFRVCGRFVDREPSRIMLGSDIASTLPNIKGRFIVKDDEFQEVQSFYFFEDRYNRINYVKQEKPVYNGHKEIKYIPQENIKIEEVKKEEPKFNGDFEFDFSDTGK